MAELFANVGRKSGKLLFTANRICELINNHQTVAVCDVDGIYEVAPIVRCKDCKHRSEEMYDYYGNPNKKVYVCQIHDIAKRPDWFCADGERRNRKCGG